MKILLVCILIINVFIFELECKNNEREKIFNAIQEMKTTFLSKNKLKIIEYFSFPIIDGDLRDIVEECNERNKKTVEKNAKKVNRLIVDKNIFYKNLDCIISKDFLRLLKRLNFDSLQISNHIEKVVENYNKNCKYIYRIDIENDTVQFSVSFLNGDNDNENSDNDCAEYNETYYFTFNGKKLIFQNLFISE